MNLNFISLIASFLSMNNPINKNLGEVYIEPIKPRMVTCDSNYLCPPGSKCIIVYGKTGYCVLLQ